MINWSKLQNGSDIRGVAMEGIPGESINLTPDIAEAIGAAFGIWLSERLNKSLDELTVAIGTDSRITGPILKESLIKGLTQLGVTCYDCDIASTPSLFMSTIFESIHTDAGIMITASHLPFNRNGMKFFTNEGGLDKKDISEILEIASKDMASDKVTAIGKTEKVDLISVYSDYLVTYIREKVNAKDYNNPLKGLKIIVDAGNGAGGFYASKVLMPLGADITGSQFLEPDGMFPNHIPNPEDQTAMNSIQEATIKCHADLGIIFDTDVDRSAIVDQSGKIINRNRLIALMSAITLEEYPGATIVTDSVTSDGLASFISSLGGKHHRFKRGYKNVINESIRLNDEGELSTLAIETSGHGAMKENYFLDDGAFTITKLLVKMAQLKSENKNLSTLIESLVEPAESQEFRVKITTEDFKTYGDTVISDLKEFVMGHKSLSAVSNNYEGVRISSTDPSSKGWMLLRLSLHDPILPINIESDVDGGVEIMKGILKAFLTKYEFLDLSVL